MKSGIKLTQSDLKIIAMLSMLVDHITAIILPLLRDSSFFIDSNFDLIYDIGRQIGRLAYPLFCFLIAEGAFYTKSRIKYAIRILLLFIISTPCHSLLIYNELIYLKNPNVLLAFFISILLILLFDNLDSLQNKEYHNKPLRILQENLILRNIVKALAFLGSIILLTALNCEYSACSPILILTFYYTKKGNGFWCHISFDYKIRQFTAAFFALFIGLFADCFFSYIRELQNSYPITEYIKYSFISLLNYSCALIALFLILLYSEKKGKNIPKFLAYSFYPLHLLILYLISSLL